MRDEPMRHNPMRDNNFPTQLTFDIDRGRMTTTVTVDLASQTVIDPAGVTYRFEIHPIRRKCLLEGLDDIARTHEYGERLAMFEDEYRAERPWLY